LLDGEEEEVVWTYKALDKRGRSIAAVLQTAASEGDRVLLLFPPGLDFIAGFIACLYANVIPVPADPPHPNRLHYKLPIINRIAEDARPSVVLLTADLYRAIRAEKAKNGPLGNCKLIIGNTNQWDDWADKWQKPMVSPGDIAWLQYTSGSTTVPKGVMVSHSNLFHNMKLIERSFDINRNTCGVIWLPPYHDMGLIGGILQPVFSGVPVVLLSNQLFLQRPIRWLKAISRFKATISGGPNFAFDLCVRKIHPEQRAQLDLSSWEVAFNGAEPVHHKTLDAFAEFFAPCGFRPYSFLPCYGLAESTLMVTGVPKTALSDRVYLRKAGIEKNQVHIVSEPSEDTLTLISSGKNLQPNQEIRIVNVDTLLPCNPNEIGEIWIQGPCVTQGYWNSPVATERTFNAQLADDKEEKYLRSGDLGFMHEGQLFLTGRIKSLIISKGKNHYPQDIERTAEEAHPAIWPAGCAAFSINDSETELIVLVVEVKHKQVTDPEKVKKAIHSAVSTQHGIRLSDIKITYPGSIPRTTSGKTRHFLCRSNYQSGIINEIELT
jgi:acyl-CoA synthetase (AMP-forming)/AMP-acid ligase II